jgi:RNA polymerase sigma-70 factor (ECF subfamily)
MLIKRCRARLGSSGLAEDALQQVFVKLIRHGAGFRAAESKLAWLYRVADNCCFDVRRGRNEPVPDDTPADDLPGSDTSGAIEDRCQASQILGRLGAPERRVAVLAYVDELSQGEIARELGCSRQTVNKKLRGLRGRLRRWLDGGA